MPFDHPTHPVRPCVCLCVVCLSWNFYIRKVCVTPTQSVDASVCGLPVIVETLRTTGMHSVMLCFFCEVNLWKQESTHTQSPVLGWNPLKNWCWWWCNAVDAVGVLSSIHMQHQRHRHSMQLNCNWSPPSTIKPSTAIKTSKILSPLSSLHHRRVFCLTLPCKPLSKVYTTHWKLGCPPALGNTIIGLQMVSNWLQKSAKCPNVLQFHYFYPFHVGRCETWIVFFF